MQHNSTGAWRGGVALFCLGAMLGTASAVDRTWGAGSSFSGTSWARAQN
ncbi:MAG: hypothetical protein Q8O57_12580 [Kiritimatiellota bacterium]|nr:hypothetical protein [Kiritimatiellota bacterium]